MFRSLTRNRAVHRVFGAVCALVCAGAAIPAGAATPANAALQVRIASRASALDGARDSIVFDLFGSAAARCAPSVQSSSVSGADIDIRVHWPTIGCLQGRVSSFLVPADVAAATGTALPRGRVYRVGVRDEEGNLLAFRVIETDPTANAPTPESGFWWPQADDASAGSAIAGSGVGIETQQSQLAINLFGFNDAGMPTWYFGTARQSGRIVAASLVELQHGDSLFAANGKRPAAQPGPRIYIQFLSPSHAHAWLVRQENGWDRDVREIDLARAPFAAGNSPASRLSGRWVLVSNGEGAPQQFDLEPQAGASASDMRLGDVAADAELWCRLDNAQVQQASLCSLSIAGSTVADFDKIGLDHLVGRTSSGATVQLLRVPSAR